MNTSVFIVRPMPRFKKIKYTRHPPSQTSLNCERKERKAEISCDRSFVFYKETSRENA